MTTSRDRQRAETREALFLASVDEILALGVAAARIDHIVRAVGVARGTFYYHFPTKDHVLYELTDRAEQLAAESIDLDGDASLAAACHGIFSSMRASSAAVGGELRREIFSAQLRRPPRAVIAPLHKKLSDAVVRAQCAGEVRAELNPLDVARTLLTGAFGALALAADNEAGSAALDLLIDITLRGVLTPQGSATRTGSAAQVRSPVRRFARLNTCEEP